MENNQENQQVEENQQNLEPEKTQTILTDSMVQDIQELTEQRAATPVQEVEVEQLNENSDLTESIVNIQEQERAQTPVKEIEPTENKELTDSIVNIQSEPRPTSPEQLDEHTESKDLTESMVNIEQTSNDEAKSESRTNSPPPPVDTSEDLKETTKENENNITESMIEIQSTEQIQIETQSINEDKNSLITKSTVVLTTSQFLNETDTNSDLDKCAELEAIHNEALILSTTKKEETYLENTESMIVTNLSSSEASSFVSSPVHAEEKTEFTNLVEESRNQDEQAQTESTTTITASTTSEVTVTNETETTETQSKESNDEYENLVKEYEIPNFSNENSLKTQVDQALDVAVTSQIEECKFKTNKFKSDLILSRLKS